MANKNGGDNSYTPLKNHELLGGAPDNRTLEQRIADGKKDEAKKEHETWVEQYQRTTPKEKGISKNEPEKDKE